MQRKAWFSSWGLTPQFFLFFILPLTLLLILVTFGGLMIHQRAMRDLVGERDVRAVRAAASALFEQINHRRIAVRTLAMSAMTLSDSDELEELLLHSEFLLPFFDQGLAFLSQDGDLVAGTGRPELWGSLSKILEFQQLLEPTSQAPVLTVSNPDTGDPIVLVSFATSSNRVAVGALSPDSLIERALAEVIIPSEGSVAYVVNQDGLLLYRAGNSIEPFSTSTHPGIAQALEGISGATYIPMDGEEHVVAYSPVPLVDWALVVEEPWAMVTTPLLDLTEQAPLVLIPVVVLSMIALWFATQRIVQPLKNLESRTTRLAWGDFAAIEEPVGGINEIRHLQVELVHMAKKLRAAQEGLRNYIGAITQGQEEERLRLARELHDDTLQSLIALKQRVQLAGLSPKGDVDLKGLKEIEGLTDQTIQNLRRVTRALRPIYLEDLGLVPALEMLAKEVETTSGIDVYFQRSGTEKRLPPITELALYRMAQEALSNAVRHANSSQAAVEIQFNGDEVRLQIADNGSGFPVPESPAEFAPRGHYGLLGLHERAEMIGAQLQIESQLDQGTRITVVLEDRANT